jgi:hypothetical protein
MNIKKIAIQGTTQEHLPIEDIASNMVILKDGSACYVLETSSVNFDLLSEREKEAMIYSYASILNSLTFPIQIFIRSTIKDVSSYLTYLRSWENKTQSRLIKKQIAHYRQFIADVVEKNNVLAKSFYLVVPFSAYELGLQSAKRGFPLFSFFKKSGSSSLPLPKEKLIERAKVSLEPKKEHLIRIFASLGLEMKQLNTKELINLFYQIYNEESISIKQIPLDMLGLDTVSAMVKKKKAAKKKDEAKPTV